MSTIDSTKKDGIFMTCIRYGFYIRMPFNRQCCTSRLATPRTRHDGIKRDFGGGFQRESCNSSPQLSIDEVKPLFFNIKTIMICHGFHFSA